MHSHRRNHRHHHHIYDNTILTFTCPCLHGSEAFFFIEVDSPLPNTPLFPNTHLFPSKIIKWYLSMVRHLLREYNLYFHLGTQRQVQPHTCTDMNLALTAFSVCVPNWFTRLWTTEDCSKRAKVPSCGTELKHMSFRYDFDNKTGKCWD